MPLVIVGVVVSYVVTLRLPDPTPPAPETTPAAPETIPPAHETIPAPGAPGT
jgi:hypothetical protein